MVFWELEPAALFFLGVTIWAGGIAALLYLIYDRLGALCLVVSRALACCERQRQPVSGKIQLGAGVAKAPQRTKEV